MRNKHIGWNTKQVKFLHDNYRIISPKDIAESLGFSKQKVVNKMSKSSISSMLVIDREQTKEMVDRLLELALEPIEIADIVGTSLNIIDKVSRLRTYKEKLKNKPCTFTETRSSIDELKRLELNNFIPAQKEDERWKYCDLSPSEQLIYHYINKDYLIDFKAPAQQFKLIA